jgi:sulfate permease, SulP family
MRGDLVAGLTVWAVLVPEALAYASIAGVSPVVGLYAAPAALLLYAAFGSSRHLVVGPMSATAALSAAAVAEVATPNSAGFVAHTTALAIATGIIALIAGLLRLGFLASFISEPVLKGFIIGLALTIVAGQLPDLFGVEGGGGDFFEKLGHLLAHLGQTSLTTLTVGLASLALVLGLRRLAPVVPGSLVAVLAGIAAVGLFNLDAHGVGIVGQIDSGLPALGTPAVAAADYLNLAPAAAGVMLVGFAEGLGAAKSYAAAHHYEVDANQELLGLGTANLGAGLASGMVVNGSLSKTAVNGAAGARSQVSGLVVAALTVLTLLYRARGPMWPCSARSRACPASTATSSGTPRTSWPRGSRCCGSRAGCSSPTPTPSGPPCGPTRPSRAPGRSSWTPRRPPTSTSAPPAC